MIVWTRPSDEPGGVPLALLFGSDGTIQIDAYEDDRPLVLSSATIDIGLNIDDTAGGANHYVDGASATVGAGYEGLDNRVSYTFATVDHPDDPEKDVTVVVTATTQDGRTLRHRFLMDLLRVVPVPVIRETDLFNRRPRLADVRELGVEVGTPTDGTTTTLTDTRLIGLPSFKGGIVEIQEGTNEGLWREISAWAPLTGTATVATAWPAAIDTTSRYRIRRSWEPVIQEAWLEIRRRIRDFAWGLDLTDPTELREPHILMSLSYAYEAIAQDEDDMRVADEYRRRASDALNAIEVSLSAHDDDEPVAQQPMSVSVVNAGRR